MIGDILKSSVLLENPYSELRARIHAHLVLSEAQRQLDLYRKELVQNTSLTGGLKYGLAILGEQS
jgi:hypothetical protein